MTRRPILGLIFLFLFAVYVYFFPRWAEWNQNSRFDLVLAVVDKGTLAIDDYYQNTGDYAAFNGHYYSDKAPGTSFAGIPVYAFFKAAIYPMINPYFASLANNPALGATLEAQDTGLLTDKLDFFVALVFVTMLVVAVPSAILGTLFYQLTDMVQLGQLERIGLTVAFGIATPSFAYANLFYGHQIAAFCLLAAFFLLFHWRNHHGAFHLVLVGFLLAFSLVTEYPTGLIIAGIGLYGLARVRPLRKWLWFVVGGVPPLAIAGAYNFAIFGTPLPVGYEYSALWQDVHRIGFLSLTLPQVEAMWGITFGAYRGLFFLSPFLLFAFPGLYFFWREEKYRAEFWVVAWSIVSFFLFNGSSVMWSGGFAIGPRYLVPVLPFLALPITFFLGAMKSCRVRVVFWVLALVSVALVWIETIGGRSYPQYDPMPLTQYSLPRFIAGDIARNFGMVLGLHGISSLIPLVLLLIGLGGIGLAGEKGYWQQSANLVDSQS